MKIKSNDRVFICGQTRTGKTMFSQWLGGHFRKVVVYDSDLEYSELGVVVTSVEDLKALFPTHAKLIFQPRNYDVELFEEVCQYLFSQYNFMFIVDEVADYAKLHKIPTYFSMMVRRGAKKGIGIITSTQRTAEVHKTVVSQSQHIISFKQWLPNDLEYLKIFMGVAAESAELLPPYHYLYFHEGKVSRHEPVKI